MGRVSNEELTPIQILQRRLRCTQVAQWASYGSIPSGGNNPLKFYLDSLREYLGKHKLFDYYHGFLCVHILVRIFQFSILSALKILGPGAFSKLGPDKDDASNILVELTSEQISTNLHPELYKNALGHYRSTTGQAIIFQKSGGFTLEEAESVLDWIWKERKAFMVIFQSKDAFIIPKYYAETFYYNINSLMAAFGKAADDNPYIEVPGLQETWTKLLRFINLQYETIEGGPVRNRITLCRNTWLVIGKAFEFQQQTSLKRRCMNPRCPDPDPAEGAYELCDQCCWISYCSIRCQAVHWGGGLPDSHRAQCTLLESQK
ncbi:unnamed protein product [Rhizoctonia solani]|uniref:MYND-type domain-containing protein n=1 Tax=Rhizoctonia solani TaxID=456999 RepID=A0A8H2XSN9_9AGAM|nr:unnamed protein product [Rhizoctonia solani]